MSPAPRGLAGPAVLMTTGTAASRALGLVRNAVLALVLTVNVAGAANAFSVANKLPNVIYMLVAGGVLNAVLVPQIVRAMRQEDGGKEYVDRLLTMAGAILAALTVVLTAAASLLVSLYGARLGEWYPIAVAFAFWCIPQLFFYGLYTLLGQVLNARSSFGPYMWAPVVNNIVAIAGLLVFIALYGTSATNGGEDPASWTPDRIAILAGTATAGVIAQALILIIPLYRSGFRWSPRWGVRGTGLGRASRVAFWAFAGLAVGQVGYVVVSNVAAAAGTAGGTSAIVAGNAAYDNAFLIYMLPQSLITVSLVTAMFTRMSKNAAAGDLEKVRGDLSFGLRTVSVFTVFASVALGVLALPVVRVVLPTVTLDEARSVAVVTIAMLVGLSALGAWTLIQRVYYAFEDTRSLFFVQIPMAVIVAGGALGAALLLEPRWWVPGAGLAMSVSTLTGAVVAYVRLRGRLEGLDAARVIRTHVRLLLAVVPAALVGWGLLHLMGVGPGENARVSAIIFASLLRVVVVSIVMLAVYLLLLRLLRVDEIDALMRPAGRLIGAIGRRLRTMTGGGRAGGAGPVTGGTSVSDVATATIVGEGISVEDETSLDREQSTETAGDRDDDTGLLGGRFRLLERLATDLPDAEAWHGHDQVLDRPVHALVLRGGTMSAAADAARRAAAVTDSRMPRVITVGQETGETFVVTDDVRGPTLAELAEGSALPAPEARAIIGEAAAALEVARRRGVHHLALRASTIRVTPHAEVVVTGLGTDAAQRGVERQDFHEASRADAVGLVSLLYLALTGTNHDATAPRDSLRAPADLRPDVPDDLNALCVTTLGPQDAGPRSPAELIRELAPWQDLATLRRDHGSGSSPMGGGGSTVHPSGKDAVPGTSDSPRAPSAPLASDWVVPEAPEPDDAGRAPFEVVLERGPARPERRVSPLLGPVVPLRHARVRDVPDAPAPGEPVAADRSASETSPPEPPRPTVTAVVATTVSGLAVASAQTVGKAAKATGHAVSRTAATTGHAVEVAAVATRHAAGKAAAKAEGAVDRTGAALTTAAGAVRKAYGRPIQEGADQPTGRFDPTPYVLAVMLGLVLFGIIWAVDILNGDPSQEVRRRPILTMQTAPAEPAATPAATPAAEADPDPADPAVP